MSSLPSFFLFSFSSLSTNQSNSQTSHTKKKKRPNQVSTRSPIPLSPAISNFHPEHLQARMYPHLIQTHTHFPYTEHKHMTTAVHTIPQRTSQHIPESRQPQPLAGYICRRTVSNPYLASPAPANSTPPCTVHSAPCITPSHAARSFPTGICVCVQPLLKPKPQILKLAPSCDPPSQLVEIRRMEEVQQNPAPA
ncbi:hypothetical protein P153DRAFT_366485 [Dothidotthia symphoricarpi CBS 119687]|uniref:Uncharacterized protein n=1 Tax=Dothidotthia symphoricarpi CBS 119687 TaxID=1392245 RepID=A0A6A6AFB9_9PLEO|nr:uncharacterized protein P153DRAFT_366485 [Dothidotthia symphoricarpi CBS 119687]KAF2129993.1 hypothetical protein P153DRAFT_366485 [Dothidotthia symphoricarpi CBS 119687]